MSSAALTRTRLEKPASARKPTPTPSAARRVSIWLFLDQLLLRLRHMPQHDVIVWHFHTRMAGVVIQRNVVDIAAGRLQIVDCLMPVDVFKGDHINCADQLARMIVSQK